MKNKILLIFVLLFSIMSLFADFDEKRIFLDNISRYKKYREYTKVEKLLNEALLKFPNDREIIIVGLDFYALMNKSKEGLDLFKEKKRLLTSENKLKYSIIFQLLNKENKYALDIAQSFLKKYGSEVNYKKISELFKRYRAYNEAVILLKQGQEIFPNKFNRSLADCYYFEKKYIEAIKNYLTLVKEKSSNYYLVKSRISSILKENSSLIQVIIDFYGNEIYSLDINKDNKRYFDIYVEALINSNELSSALKILEKYPAYEIYRKAEVLNKKQDYKQADNFYLLAIKKEKDVLNKNKYLISYAKSLINYNNPVKADSVLTSVIDTSMLRDSKFNNELFECYMLKADIELKFYSNLGKYLELLNASLKKSYYANHKRKIYLRLAKFYTYTNQRDLAKDNIDKSQKYGKTDLDFTYTNYLYSLSDFTVAPDSLITEMMLLKPESEKVYEALKLKFLLKDIKKEDKAKYLSAFFNAKLYNITESDSLYMELYKNSANEYFVIQNAIMNQEHNRIKRCIELFSMPFEDEFCRDYARVSLLSLSGSNPKEIRSLARNLLTEYPNSNFVAEIRKFLR